MSFLDQPAHGYRMAPKDWLEWRRKNPDATPDEIAAADKRFTNEAADRLRLCIREVFDDLAARMDLSTSTERTQP
jgi:nicotinamide mononucleotide adenylyltransferase